MTARASQGPGRGRGESRPFRHLDYDDSEDRKQILIGVADLVRGYPRVAIAGGPLTGKSLIADQITDRPAIHTDAYISSGWGEIVPLVLAEAQRHPRFVLSGVKVGAALRDGLIVDAAVWLDIPLHPLAPRQEGMRKQCVKVFNEWLLSRPSARLFSI